MDLAKEERIDFQEKQLFALIYGLVSQEHFIQYVEVELNQYK